MSSIFSEENKSTGNWIKFSEVGDKFEGTYVSKRVVPNRLKPGTEQTIYEFLKDGEIFLYGSKPAVDDQLKYVTPGQIVGLEFLEEKAPKTAGHSATKIIITYHNKNVVDEEWLKQQALDSAVASFGGSVESEEPHYAPIPDFSSDTAGGDKVLAEILTLGKAKLGAETDEESKMIIMEATKLAFLPLNYPQILEALKTL